MDRKMSKEEVNNAVFEAALDAAHKRFQEIKDFPGFLEPLYLQRVSVAVIPLETSRIEEILCNSINKAAEEIVNEF